MASFLVRALDLPAATQDWFTDDEASIHESNINRIAEAGIASGCGGTKYCPKAVVSREQMASFLARALDLSGAAPDAFTDDETSIHEPNVRPRRPRRSRRAVVARSTARPPSSRVVRWLPSSIALSTDQGGERADGVACPGDQAPGALARRRPGLQPRAPGPSASLPSRRSQAALAAGQLAIVPVTAG